MSACDDTALITWVQQCLSGEPQLEALPLDASFRRYFRVFQDDQTYILMDASREKDSVARFVAVAEHFKQLAVNVPVIFHQDLEKGFLLLTDFGEVLYSSVLNQTCADQLYRVALDMLVKIQHAQPTQACPLPAFDKTAMQAELDLFSDWFLEQHMGLTLSLTEQRVLQATFDYLLTSATDQPQVCIHRDYHSRNLLWLSDDTVGVIDFQDAMWGPVTYDAVSLLRDCYVDWPQDQVTQWLFYYIQQATAAGTVPVYPASQWQQWFDLMGMQRHLKAIFIFSRKYLRDHDDRYLQDIPRALKYIDSVATRYEPLADFKELLLHRIMPRYQEVQYANL